MAIRLAYDPLLIQHGNVTVRLRPSLRAGLLIAQKYRISTISDALDEANFTFLSEIVGYGTDDPKAAQAILFGKLCQDGPLSLHEFTPAILQFIGISMGITADREDASEVEQQADTLPSLDFTDALTDLFEFATGWLHWSPTETWAATPAEIIIARKGRFAMLNAIHGTGEKPADDPRDLPTNEDVKNGIARLRSLSGEKA